MAYQQIKTVVVRMMQGAELPEGLRQIQLLADTPGGLDDLVRVASEEEDAAVADILWWMVVGIAARTGSWSVYAMCRNRLDSVSWSRDSETELLLAEWDMWSLAADGNWRSLRDVIDRLRERPLEPYPEHVCLSFEGVLAASEGGNRAEALRLLEASCHVDRLLTSDARYAGLCRVLYDTLIKQGVDPATKEMRTFADMQAGIDGRIVKRAMARPGAT